MRQTKQEIVLAACRLCDSVTERSKFLAGQFLNDIQEDMQRRHNWKFFKERSGALGIAENTGTYDLPDNFHRLNYIYYLDRGDFMYLDPSSDDDYFDEIDETDSGTPRIYRLMGLSSSNFKLQVQIGPPPDATFISNYTDIYIEQHKQATDLTEDGQYPDWPGEFTLPLKMGTARLLAAKQGDVAKYQGFNAEYEKALAGLIAADKLVYKKMFRGRPARAACARGVVYGRRIR